MSLRHTYVCGKDIRIYVARTYVYMSEGLTYICARHIRMYVQGTYVRMWKATARVKGRKTGKQEAARLRDARSRAAERGPLGNG